MRIRGIVGRINNRSKMEMEILNEMLYEDGVIF